MGKMKYCAFKIERQPKNIPVSEHKMSEWNEYKRVFEIEIKPTWDLLADRTYHIFIRNGPLIVSNESSTGLTIDNKSFV